LKCIVIAAGEIKDYSLHQKYIDDQDCIICADAGARHALAMGKTPDYLLGDFDSLGGKLLETLKNIDNPPELIKFPENKDKTDTHLAVEFALTMNPEKILIMGGTGSRLDHTLANITLLAVFPDAPILIVNDNNELFLITDSTELYGEPGERISLLPMTPIVKGVTLRGLKWPLVDHTIEMGDSLGISNEIIQRNAGVSLTEGKLLVIRSRD